MFLYSLFSNWKNNKESIEKVQNTVFSVLQTETEKIFRFHLEFVSILVGEVEWSKQPSWITLKTSLQSQPSLLSISQSYDPIETEEEK